MVSTLYMYVHFLLNFNFWSLMEGPGLLVAGTDDQSLLSASRITATHSFCTVDRQWRIQVI